MNLLFALAALSVLALSSAIPLNMMKEKKGEEKAMLLNTDRDGHVVKRAKEVLMFGNQQNSPRLKKSDPEKELLSTSDKSSSSSEGDTEEGEVVDKSSPESDEDRSSELLNVDKIIQQAEAESPDSDSDADREALPFNDPEDNPEAVREAVREANIVAHQEADREAVREAVREANLEARHKAEDEAVREAVREANLEADHKANLEANKVDDEAEDEADSKVENEAVREAVREANIEARHKAENEAVREAVREANHEADLQTANEVSEENKSGSSDADGQLGDGHSQQLVDDSDEDDDGDDNSQLLAVQSIPVSLGVDDAAKTLAGLNKVSLDKETPLLTNQGEEEEGKEFPDLGEELAAEKPVDYDEILREYEHANAADLQRQRALHSSPFLNYIYRKEMEGRPQRTKRELLLPEDAEQYLKGGIPEKLVTLESWPNAYSQSELLEKEAPYQIVDKPHFEDNVGYGYQKRSDEVDEDVDETVEPEIEEEVPYEEVVLNGRPGYFIPAKREFFPYAEEPVSHYSGLVDKRKDEVDYARLLRLARALAVQHDDNSIFSQA